MSTDLVGFSILCPGVTQEESPAGDSGLTAKHERSTSKPVTSGWQLWRGCFPSIAFLGVGTSRFSLSLLVATLSTAQLPRGVSSVRE